MFTQIKRLLVICFCISLQFTSFAQEKKFILDADTGNELDDFYAIARAFINPCLPIIGLTSAHYNNVQIFVDSIWNGNPVKNFNTVAVSQEYNEALLRDLNKLNIPHPIGCTKMLGYAYGYYPTAPIPTSPAVEFIINEARKASPKNKLGVICIGASTNLAAAIETAPDIAANIHAYLLGCQYDAATRVWNKSEFNIRNDLNAFDVILNSKQLDLTIMPINTARPFVFSKTETLKRLYAMKHPVPDQLANIWPAINAGEERVMWDLALIIAIIKPELATLEDRPGPPENANQKVHVYTAIKLDAMKNDFWKAMEAAF